jgi:hypothetical protein
MDVSLVIVLLLGAVSIIEAVDLCSMYKHIVSDHSSCLPLKGPKATSAEITKILNYHNQVRQETDSHATNMLKMTWDDNLADVAQRKADTCQYGHDTSAQRKLYGYFSVGQNYALSTRNDWVTAMQQWENEKAHYKYKSYVSGNTDHTGHYTQMIWANTYKVGCGKAECPYHSAAHPSIKIAYHYVCNYGPAGNYNHQTPYHEGTTASACKTKDGKLCDCGDKVCYNRGTLDASTCTCHCYQSFYHGNDGCKLHCSSVHTDPSTCHHYTFAKCAQYSNVPAMCPNLCKLCPALAHLP